MNQVFLNLTIKNLKTGSYPIKLSSKIKTNPKEDRQQLEDRNKKSILNSFVARVKSMNEDERPTVLMKYNNMSSDLRDLFRNKYPNF